MITSKEHYEMMDFFERHIADGRKDREHKDFWPKGNIYQDGQVNKQFLAFRQGVSYGKIIDR